MQNDSYTSYFSGVLILPGCVLTCFLNHKYKNAKREDIQSSQYLLSSFNRHSSSSDEIYTQLNMTFSDSITTNTNTFNTSSVHSSSSNSSPFAIKDQEKNTNPTEPPPFHLLTEKGSDIQSIKSNTCFPPPVTNSNERYSSPPPTYDSIEKDPLSKLKAHSKDRH